MRDDLPSGRLALLFSDIEGSTALLQRLGPRDFAALLSRHHEACREVWRRHGGTVVDTAGDGFFVVLPSARHAALAAAEAQRALAVLDLRVRMGIHLADLAPGTTGYVGLEVHRAARLAAAAHGGQVVLTDEASRAVGEDLALLDLGRHRLKDIEGTTHVYQLGDGDFPPLRTVFRRTLPIAATPLLGRGADVADLVLRVREGARRVVTVVGAAGLGKTRLALAAAERLGDDMPGGTWWVPLAAEQDAESGLRALALALEVQEVPGGDLLERVVERIGDERLLLVVDNAEHLLPGLALSLSRLVSRCPHAAVLVTSRTRLGIAAEQVVTPDALDDAAAAALYQERAHATGAVVDDPAAVVHLCRLLDNLPLAIELVAGRAAELPASQAVGDLTTLLDGFAGPIDADHRHRTLRAALEWSHRLLDPEQRQALVDVSVFAADIDAEAASGLCGVQPRLLDSLADAGLLRREPGSSPARWSMLRTVREFGRDLAGDQLDPLLRAHAAWVQAWIGAMPTRNPMRHPAPTVAAMAARRDEWRQALRTTAVSDPALYAEIAATVWGDLFFAGAFGEAVEIIDRALQWCDDPTTRGLLVHGLVLIGYRMPGGRDVAALAREELELAERSGSAAALVDAWRSVGCACLATGDDTGSIAASERSLSLALQSGDVWGAGMAAQNVGNSRLNLGESSAALEQFAVAGGLAVDAGDEYGLMLARSNSVDALLALSRDDEAVALLPLVLDEDWTEQRAWTVEVVGLLALRRGLAADFARLSAAAGAAFDSLEQPRTGYALVRYVAAADQAAQELGTPLWVELTARGRELDLDTAHAEACVLLETWLSVGGTQE